MAVSPLAEMVPTWATSELDEMIFLALPRFSTTSATARSMPRFEIHRVHAGGNQLDAFVDDGLAEHGRGRGAVTGDVVGLRGHGAQHLGAHVLELVFQLDLLGDGDAVLGDARGAERLVDHDVAALRTQRDLHRIGEDVDAADHLVAGIGGELYVFSGHWRRSLRLKNAKKTVRGECLTR